MGEVIKNSENKTERPPTIGQRSADFVAGLLGSWTFIICQTFFLALWITFNVIAIFRWHWDPYPFVFLNLMLSFQAAYSAPFIMMSQNRQSEVDRKRTILDFEIDKKAELEVEDIQDHLHRNDEDMENLKINVAKIMKALNIE